MKQNKCYIIYQCNDISNEEKLNKIGQGRKAIRKLLLRQN